MSEAKKRKQAAIDSASQQDLQQRLGQRLTEARNQKNIDIVTIANRLRLQKSYLEALESGDWQCLPDKVYAMGFLRQYAEALKIDVADECSLLKSGTYSLKPSHTISDPSILPSINWFRITLFLFVVMFILFNTMYFSQQEPESIDSNDYTPAAVQEKEKHNTPQITKAETTAQLDNIDLKDAQDVIQKAIELDEVLSADGTEEILQPESQLNPEVLTPVVTQQTTDTYAQTPLHRYQFSAKDQDVWIKVVDADKKILLKTLIPSGKTRSIQHPSSSLYITCGNAVALTVRMNGKEIVSAGELGKSGQVIRHYRIGQPTTADE